MHPYPCRLSSCLSILISLHLADLLFSVRRKLEANVRVGVYTNHNLALLLLLLLFSFVCPCVVVNIVYDIFDTTHIHGLNVHI